MTVLKVFLALDALCLILLAVVFIYGKIQRAYWRYEDKVEAKMQEVRRCK